MSFIEETARPLQPEYVLRVFIILKIDADRANKCDERLEIRGNRVNGALLRTQTCRSPKTDIFVLMKIS